MPTKSGSAKPLKPESSSPKNGQSANASSSSLPRQTSGNSGIRNLPTSFFCHQPSLKQNHSIKLSKAATSTPSSRMNFSSAHTSLHAPKNRISGTYNGSLSLLMKPTACGMSIGPTTKSANPSSRPLPIHKKSCSPQPPCRTPCSNSTGWSVLLMITPSVTSKASSQTMRGSVMANNLPTSKSASNRSANAPFAVRCSNTSTSPIGLQLSKSFTPTRRSRNSMTTFQTT